MAFNPAPLGLFGFASATILLNLHNMGLYGLTVVVVGMGIALGGLAQLCAGVFEMIHKNIFGGLAFFSYGGFWWSLVLIWLLPGCTDIAKPNEGEMALYLCVWGIFTTGMFFGTLKGPIIGSVVFFSLAVLFYALGIRDCLYGILGTEHFLSKTVGALSGIWGVWTGLTAFYEAFAIVYEDKYGRQILPVGKRNLFTPKAPKAPEASEISEMDAESITAPIVVGDDDVVEVDGDVSGEDMV